jgi:hypothetical protein
MYISTLRPKSDVRVPVNHALEEGRRAPLHITVIEILICVHSFLFLFFLSKSPILDKVEKELRKKYLKEVS